MNIFATICDSLLTPVQTIIVCVCCVLAVALIAVNVLLILHFRKNRDRKLCTYQLQNKRDELLDQLRILINGGTVAFDSEEDVDEESLLMVENDDADDTDESEQPEQHYLGVVEREDVDETLDAKILSVSELSTFSRSKLGLVGSKYDDKRYYVRYSYGFEAMLRNSDDEVKNRYSEIMNEFYQYKINMQLGYSQIRIYKGHTTLALVTFSGKTLCVAFALNPSAYMDSAYNGVNKADKKRYAKTPMVVRLTSQRQVQYAKYLMLQLALTYTIVLDDQVQTLKFDLSNRTVSQLFDEDKLRISLLGEVPAGSVQLDEDEITEEVEEEVEEEELNEELAQEEYTRYNRSFIARIIQADDELKARYSELKNHILCYKNVYNKITWKREAFYSEKRTCIATFAIHGKTLCLFLATDPAKFDGTKYKVENRAEKRPNTKMPTMLRIRSDRSTKFAKEILNIVFAEQGLKENVDYMPTNFRPAYRSTENLIKKGYIHATNSPSYSDKK